MASGSMVSWHASFLTMGVGAASTVLAPIAVGVVGLAFVGAALDKISEVRERDARQKSFITPDKLQEEKFSVRPGWEDKTSLDDVENLRLGLPRDIDVGEAEFHKNWTQTDIIDEILRQSGDPSIPEQSKIANGSGSFGVVKALSHSQP